MIMKRCLLSFGLMSFNSGRFCKFTELKVLTQVQRIWPVVSLEFVSAGAGGQRVTPPNGHTM